MLSIKVDATVDMTRYEVLLSCWSTRVSDVTVDLLTDLDKSGFLVLGEAVDELVPGPGRGPIAPRGRDLTARGRGLSPSARSLGLRPAGEPALEAVHHNRGGVGTERSRGPDTVETLQPREHL